MGKYNKKPKLRSVTRTRSKKRKGVDRIVKEQDLIGGGYEPEKAAPPVIPPAEEKKEAAAPVASAPEERKKKSKTISKMLKTLLKKISSTIKMMTKTILKKMMREWTKKNNDRFFVSSSI